MDHLTIEGVPGYDGRYEFDLHGTAFTTREWGWIKRHSGYLPLTMWDGWRGSDPELMSVFALIALVRAGKVDRDDAAQVFERFQDAPGITTIKLELEASEDDVPDPPESSNGKPGSSGTGSSESSETQDETQLPSGIRGSATSESRPAIVSGS